MWLLFFSFGSSKQGRLYYPSTWRCRTNDCSHVDQKHTYGLQKRVQIWLRYFLKKVQVYCYPVPSVSLSRFSFSYCYYSLTAIIFYALNLSSLRIWFWLLCWFVVRFWTFHFNHRGQLVAKKCFFAKILFYRTWSSYILHSIQITFWNMIGVSCKCAIRFWKLKFSSFQLNTLDAEKWQFNKNLVPMTLTFYALAKSTLKLWLEVSCWCVPVIRSQIQVTLDGSKFDLPKFLISQIPEFMNSFSWSPTFIHVNQSFSAYRKHKMYTTWKESKQRIG